MLTNGDSVTILTGELVTLRVLHCVEEPLKARHKLNWPAQIQLLRNAISWDPVVDK